MSSSVSAPPGLWLSPLELKDLNEIFRLWSDWEAVRNTNWAYTPTLDECSSRLKRTLEYYGQNPLHFGPHAIRTSDMQFAGIIGADAKNEDPGSYDLWYFLDGNQRRKGIAKSAVLMLLDLMNGSGRVQRVTATAVVDNPASWGLLEKIGFKRLRRIEGGHKKHGLSLDLFEYELPLISPERSSPTTTQQ